MRRQRSARQPYTGWFPGGCFSGSTSPVTSCRHWGCITASSSVIEAEEACKIRPTLSLFLYVPSSCWPKLLVWTTPVIPLDVAGSLLSSLSSWLSGVAQFNSGSLNIRSHMVEARGSHWERERSPPPRCAGESRRHAPALLFSRLQLIFCATVCAIAIRGACERGCILPLIPFRLRKCYNPVSVMIGRNV
jgi:hypothetical protein